MYIAEYNLKNIWVISLDGIKWWATDLSDIYWTLEALESGGGWTLNSQYDHELIENCKKALKTNSKIFKLLG